MVIIDGAKDRDGIPLRVRVDPYVLRDTERLRERNEKYFYDSFIVISGDSGDGKSTLGIQTLAPLLARKTENIYITFSTDEAIAVGTDPNTEELSVIVIDEGEKDTSSSQYAAASFKRFRNFLSLARQRRYYIILLLPSFFILSSSLAIFRSNVLYHVSANNNRRGYIDVFGRNAKKYLYIKGKKYFDLKAQSSDYAGTFTLNAQLLEKIFPDYVEKKLKHFREQTKQDKLPGAGIREDRANYILENLIIGLKKMDKKYWIHQKIADLCGIGESTVRKLFKQLKDSGRVSDELINQCNWQNKLKINLQNTVKNTPRVAKSSAIGVVNTIYTGENQKPNVTGAEVI